MEKAGLRGSAFSLIGFQAMGQSVQTAAGTRAAYRLPPTCGSA